MQHPTRGCIRLSTMPMIDLSVPLAIGIGDVLRARPRIACPHVLTNGSTTGGFVAQIEAVHLPRQMLYRHTGCVGPSGVRVSMRLLAGSYQEKSHFC